MSKQGVLPTWIHRELDLLSHNLRKNLEGLVVKPGDTVLVASAVLCGDDNYSASFHEQATDFEPARFGPTMHLGYSIMAAGCLQRRLKTLRAACQTVAGATAEAGDSADLMASVRASAHQVIAQFVGRVMRFAAMQMQKTEPADVFTAAMSQALGLWAALDDPRVIANLMEHQQEDGHETRNDPSSSSKPGRADQGSAGPGM